MGRTSRKDHTPTDRNRTLSTKSKYYENSPGSLQILKDRAYLVQVNGERTRIELPDSLKKGALNAPKEGEIVFLDSSTPESIDNNNSSGISGPIPTTD